MDESELLIREIDKSGLAVGPSLPSGSSEVLSNDGDAQDPDYLAEIDSRALLDLE